MRITVFAKRNLKEMVRDPLSSVFGLGFPVIVLLLLFIINKNIPEEASMTIFDMENLMPAVCVFGLSFISLFSGMLIAKDRTSSLFMRLLASPMSGADFIFGYTLPILPLAFVQIAVCVVLALIMGLKAGAGIIVMIFTLMPSAVLFIACGLLIGTLVSDKAVGGICSVLVNLCAWLSGAWFDISLLGGTFAKICRILPFANAVDCARYVLAQNYSDAVKPLLIICAYAVGMLIIAVAVFSKKTAK